MPNIAIVGTQGAGKTVFITVFARHLLDPSAKRFFLDPEPRTFKYIETNWHTLNHREWPSHTTAGNSFELRWKLRFSGPGDKPDGEMRVIDTSGHDIRSIFADDRVTSLDMLPAALRPIADYCRTADVAVFLADLNDYIERTDGTEHIENETILKSAMDFLRKNGRRYCLVLTKADMYRDYASAEGGWDGLAAKHLRSVFRSHLASGVPYFRIASVNMTETIVEGERTRSVPVPGFDSKGIDEFSDWLSKMVEAGAAPLAIHPVKPTPPAPWPIAAAGVLGILVFLATCTKTVPGGWSSSDKTEFDFDSIPIAVFAFLLVWGLLAACRFLVIQVSKIG